MHSVPTYTTCTHIHSPASIRAGVQHKYTENRNAFLPTRPEDVLDPGDGAAGVSPAGGGASGRSSAAPPSYIVALFVVSIKDGLENFLSCLCCEAGNKMKQLIWLWPN